MKNRELETSLEEERATASVLRVELDRMQAATTQLEFNPRNIESPAALALSE